MVEKWFTRDKLRRTENKFTCTDEKKSTNADVDESSSDEEDVPHPRSSTYNLREQDRLRIPDRYGPCVTHFVNSFDM